MNASGIWKSIVSPIGGGVAKNNGAGTWIGGADAWTTDGTYWPSGTAPSVTGGWTIPRSYKCPVCGSRTTSYGTDPEKRLHDRNGRIVWSGCDKCYEELHGQTAELLRRVQSLDELAALCEMAAEHIEALSPTSPIAKHLKEAVDFARRIDAEAVLDGLEST